MPGLKEVRTHAKCLRSTEQVRNYFRKYRAARKANSASMRTSGSDSESEGTTPGESNPAIQSALMGCSSMPDPGSASKPPPRPAASQSHGQGEAAFGLLPFVFGVQGATGGALFLPGAGGALVNLARQAVGAAVPVPSMSGHTTMQGAGGARSPSRGNAVTAAPATSVGLSQHCSPGQFHYGAVAAPASSMGLPPRQPASAATTKPAAPPPMPAAATSGPVVSFARNGAPQRSSRCPGATHSIGGGIVLQMPGSGGAYQQQHHPTTSTAKHASPAPEAPPAKRQATHHPAHSGPTGTVYHNQCQSRPSQSHGQGQPSAVQFGAQPATSMGAGAISTATASHYSVPVANGTASRRGDATCSRPCVGDVAPAPAAHNPCPPGDVAAGAAALEAVVDPDCDDPAHAFFSAWQGHDIDDLLTDLPPDVAQAGAAAAPAHGAGAGTAAPAPSGLTAATVRTSRPGASTATAVHGAENGVTQLVTPTAATVASVLASEQHLAHGGVAAGGEAEGGGLSPGLNEDLFKALDLPVEKLAAPRPARPAPSTVTVATAAAPPQQQANQGQQAQSQAPGASQANSAAPGLNYPVPPPGTYPPMYPAPWAAAPYGYPHHHPPPPGDASQDPTASQSGAPPPPGAPAPAGSQPYPSAMYPGYPYPYPPYGYPPPPPGYPYYYPQPPVQSGSGFDAYGWPPYPYPPHPGMPYPGAPYGSGNAYPGWPYGQPPAGADPSALALGAFGAAGATATAEASSALARTAGAAGGARQVNGGAGSSTGLRPAEPLQPGRYVWQATTGTTREKIQRGGGCNGGSEAGGANDGTMSRMTRVGPPTRTQSMAQASCCSRGNAGQSQSVGIAHAPTPARTTATVGNGVAGRGGEVDECVESGGLRPAASVAPTPGSQLMPPPPPRQPQGQPARQTTSVFTAREHVGVPGQHVGGGDRTASYASEMPSLGANGMVPVAQGPVNGNCAMAAVEQHEAVPQYQAKGNLSAPPTRSAEVNAATAGTGQPTVNPTHPEDAAAPATESPGEAESPSFELPELSDAPQTPRDAGCNKPSGQDAGDAAAGDAQAVHDVHNGQPPQQAAQSAQAHSARMPVPTGSARGAAVSSYDDDELLDLSTITAGLFSPPGSMVQATGSCRGGWGAAGGGPTASRGPAGAEETPSASTAAAAAAASTFAFTPIQAYAVRRTNPFAAAPRAPASALRAHDAGGDGPQAHVSVPPPGSSARRGGAATPRAAGSPLDCALLASWLTSPANTASLDMCVRLGLLGEELHEAGDAAATAAAREAVVKSASASEEAGAAETPAGAGVACGALAFLGDEKPGVREEEAPAAGQQRQGTRADGLDGPDRAATGATTTATPASDPDVLACIQITHAAQHAAAATAGVCKAGVEEGTWACAPSKVDKVGATFIENAQGHDAASAFAVSSVDGTATEEAAPDADLQRTVTLGAVLVV